MTLLRVTKWMFKLWWGKQKQRAGFHNSSIQIQIKYSKKFERHVKWNVFITALHGYVYIAKQILVYSRLRWTRPSTNFSIQVSTRRGLSEYGYFERFSYDYEFRLTIKRGMISVNDPDPTDFKFPTLLELCWISAPKYELTIWTFQRRRTRMETFDSWKF